MENHTKRIRKARRQGLARKKDLSEPNRRLQVRAGRKPTADTPGTPSPGRRNDTMTQRKMERLGRQTTRRGAGRRVRG